MARAPSVSRPAGGSRRPSLPSWGRWGPWVRSPGEREALTRLELEERLLAARAVAGAQDHLQRAPVVGDGHADLVPDAHVVHLVGAVGVLEHDAAPGVELVLDD